MARSDQSTHRAGRPTNREIRRAVGRVSPFTTDTEAAAGPLSLRQRRILQVIETTVAERGYPPTVREICDAVGLASPSSGAHQLKVLEERGYLRRDPNRPRALEVVQPSGDVPPTPVVSEPEPSAGLAPIIPLPTRTVAVPLVGRIAAGQPILATEQVEETFALPSDFVGQGTLFMLQVQGDSMIEAAICDGDYVVVRSQPVAENGDVVAALLDDEATVKTYQRTDDQVWLLPRNPLYAPINGNEATILGKVVTVLRRL
ncbi:MAG: transcriptional repressor LexA [Propionibacteriaceae bacterium]|jgi:repressor LexA|nr:transcriptional repressor LexA [Propionibacteriaceae bacterium]